MSDFINLLSFNDLTNYSHFENINITFKKPVRNNKEFFFRFENKVCFNLPNIEQLNLQEDHISYKLDTNNEQFGNFIDFLNNFDNFVVNLIHTNSYSWIKQKLSTKIVLEGFKSCYEINNDEIKLNINILNKEILKKFSDNNRKIIVSIDKIIFNKEFYVNFTLEDILDNDYQLNNTESIDLQSILDNNLSLEEYGLSVTPDLVEQTNENNIEVATADKEGPVHELDAPENNEEVSEVNDSDNALELEQDQELEQEREQEQEQEQELELNTTYSNLNNIEVNESINTTKQGLNTVSNNENYIGVEEDIANILEFNQSQNNHNERDNVSIKSLESILHENISNIPDTATIYSNNTNNANSENNDTESENIEKISDIDFEDLVLKKRIARDFDSVTQILSYEDYKNVENINVIKKKITKKRREQIKLRENSRRADNASKLLKHRAESLTEEIKSYELQLTNSRNY